MLTNKRQNTCCAWTLAAWLVTPFGTDAQAEPFIQDSGLQGIISMEAEHYKASVVAPDGHEWLSVGSSFGVASGADAVRALPEDNVGYSSNYASLSPRMDYEVNFAVTGTHYVWVRAQGPSTSSDSLNVGLDGQEVASSKNMRGPVTGGYVWAGAKANGTRATLNVDAGLHTVNVWMRESGTVIDKVVLTTDAGFNPSNCATCNGGLGPNETVETSVMEADLAVTTLVDNAAPNEGDTLIYTVSVTNNGPVGATSVRLIDVLPAGLSYVTDDAAASGTLFDSGTGVWVVGGLSNASSALLHITATVNSGTSGLTLTNIASVHSSDQTDPVSGNNSAAAGITVGTPSGTSAFQQDLSGLVTMEAENYHYMTTKSGHFWTTIVGPVGYAAAGAMQALPDSGLNVSDISASPRLSFQINFRETGTHYVTLRGFAANGAANSLYLGLDNQKTQQINFGQLNTYLWKKTNTTGARAVVEVSSPGLHTLDVWMREDGLVLDKLVITNDPNYAPQGTGPVESVGGGSPGIITFGSSDPTILMQSPLTSAAAVTATPQGTITGAPSFHYSSGMLSGATGGAEFLAAYPGTQYAGQLSIEVETQAIVQPSPDLISNGIGGSEGFNHLADGWLPILGLRTTDGVSSAGGIGITDRAALGGNLFGTNFIGKGAHSAGKSQFAKITLSWVGSRCDLYVDGLLHNTITLPPIGSPARLDIGRIIIGDQWPAPPRIHHYYVRNIVLASRPVSFKPHPLLGKVVIYGDSFASQSNASVIGSTHFDATAGLQLIRNMNMRGTPIGQLVFKDYSGQVLNKNPSAMQISFQLGNTRFGVTANKLADVVNANADFVLIMGGTNDATGDAASRGILTPSFAADLFSMCRTILDNKKTKGVIIQTLMSTKGDSRYASSRYATNIATLNAIIRNLPSTWDATYPSERGKIKVVDTFTATGGEYAATNMSKGTLTGALDDLHPSAFAAVISANLIADALSEFIE